jgi:hypothetical protein
MLAAAIGQPRERGHLLIADVANPEYESQVRMNLCVHMYVYVCIPSLKHTHA